MDYKLDMSAMLAIHQALRRDLERLGRIAARPDGNPARLLQARAGWEQFKEFLVAHHTAEDRALWPALREADQQTLDAVLGKFPPQLVTAFHEQWAPAYAARDVWKGV